MLISDSYLKLNKELHAGAGYGIAGDRWLEMVEELVSRYQPDTILDYGCGKGALGRKLGRPIAEYDPAIEGKESLPAPADLVICTDVLEHIEPELIDDVLDHLHSLTRQCLFAVISTRPARKILADGRNAHLIVEPWDWWEKKLHLRFDVAQADVDPLQAVLVLLPISKGTSAYRRSAASLIKLFRRA